MEKLLFVVWYLVWKCTVLAAANTFTGALKMPQQGNLKYVACGRNQKGSNRHTRSAYSYKNLRFNSFDFRTPVPQLLDIVFSRFAEYNKEGSVVLVYWSCYAVLNSEMFLRTALSRFWDSASSGRFLYVLIEVCKNVAFFYPFYVTELAVYIRTSDAN